MFESGVSKSTGSWLRALGNPTLVVNNGHCVAVHEHFSSHRFTPFRVTFLGRKKREASSRQAQIVHDCTVTIKDSMKACRPDISRTLFRELRRQLLPELKIPAIVIIQERAKGYFDTVTLGNRVVGYCTELHSLRNTR